MLVLVVINAISVILLIYTVNDFTIIAHADLVCDNQTYRNLIQSTLYIGSVMGLFIMNMLSDTKGRKFSFLLSWGIANVGIMCKFWIYSFSPHFRCLYQSHSHHGACSDHYRLWRILHNDYWIHNYFRHVQGYHETKSYPFNERCMVILLN